MTKTNIIMSIMLCLCLLSCRKNLLTSDQLSPIGVTPDYLLPVPTPIIRPPIIIIQTCYRQCGTDLVAAPIKGIVPLHMRPVVHNFYVPCRDICDVVITDGGPSWGNGTGTTSTGTGGYSYSNTGSGGGSSGSGWLPPPAGGTGGHPAPTDTVVFTPYNPDTPTNNPYRNLIFDKDLDLYDDATTNRIAEMAGILTDLTPLEKQYMLANVDITAELYGLFIKDPTQEAMITLRSLIRSLVAGTLDLTPSLALIGPPFTGVDVSLWAANYRLEVAYTRAEHPEYSKIKIYYEAMKEEVHTVLDGIGLVPVAGEICDLANGVLYRIDGDMLNARLSVVSAVPLYGWGAASIKLGKKMLTTSLGKTTLKWYRSSLGVISFNRPGQLRRVLGIVNPLMEAHHIIPYKLSNHRVVQQAAKLASAAGQDIRAFHPNELTNGIALRDIFHRISSGNHPYYTDRVFRRLEAVPATVTPYQARLAIDQIISDIRHQIALRPLADIETLIF